MTVTSAISVISGRAAAILLGLCLSFVTASAFAQGVERIGDYGDWSAFKLIEGGQPTCYIATQPASAQGNYSRRGEIYAMVTQRPSEGRLDEVSFLAGYTYREGSIVAVDIDGQTWNFFTYNDGAWAPNPDIDRAVVQGMINGVEMVVQGTSSRGTLTNDSYSLRGFTAAYNAAKATCGL